MDFSLKRALAGRKAIADNPVFHDGVPTTVYSPGAARQNAQLSQEEARRHGEAYGGNQAIDWVYDAVNLYASTTSTAAWSLEQDEVPMVRMKTDDTPSDYKVGPADLYTLLDQPNPFMLYDELVELLVMDLLLVGNGYWLKWQQNSLGQPLALYRLAPAYVKITPGKFGPTGYEYQPPGASTPLKFGPDDVLHFRRPNPHSAYYGMGVIRGGGRAFDVELSVTDTMASYYENKADPSMIVQSDRRVPRDVFNKLRNQLRARVAGSNRAGELLVLEAGLKASTLSPSASDALFATVGTMSRDRIFAMFRTNPKLFGIMDEAGGSTNISDARREFDTYVIRPFMDKLQRLISFGLTHAWDVDFKIDYRYSMAVEDLVKNVSSLSAIPGIKVREVRRLLAPLGISESTGDPEIDEQILNAPGQELDEDGQGGFADRPLAGEPGRPPKGENTVALGNAAKVQSPSKKTFEEIEYELRIRTATAEVKAILDKPGSPIIKGEKRPADPFAKDRSADIDDVTLFIQDGLAKAALILERGLLDHVEGKAFQPNNLKSRLRKSTAWKTFTDQIEKVLMEGAMRAISSATLQSGRPVDEELDYQAIAESVVKRPDGLRKIVRTMKDRLLAKTSAKLGNKEVTAADVQVEIQNAIKDWSRSDGQSSVVAISEAVEAYNEGTLSVAETLGITDVFVEDGHDHDAPCLEADGQTWDLATARARRKEHPNCRRAFILPEESQATVAA